MSFCFVNKSCLAFGQQFIFQQDGACGGACCKSDSAVSCMQFTVQTLLTKTPDHQITLTWIRLTIMFGGRCCRTSVTRIRSRRTSRNWSRHLWRSGTSYHKTQYARRSRISGNVCEKRRWRTFWAFTVTLLIDLCLLFLQLWKQKGGRKCFLILRPCSVEIFAWNVQFFIISEVLK